jgi:hypothetical protein
MQRIKSISTNNLVFYKNLLISQTLDGFHLHNLREKMEFVIYLFIKKLPSIVFIRNDIVAKELMLKL